MLNAEHTKESTQGGIGDGGNKTKFKLRFRLGGVGIRGGVRDVKLEA